MLKGIFPKETKAFLESLRDDRFIWVDNGPVTKDEGVTDETHKVVEVQTNPTESGEEPTKELHQLTLIEDVNARVFRMGYTLNEINDLIEELS